MKTKTNTWRPTASIEMLQQRAKILQQIRKFFHCRNVLEVETPLLASTTATDPHIHSFAVNYSANKTLYLQTSPEFAMKRLLAAQSGSIFQICKAFRRDESGQQHNSEFTLLEWYRTDFNHHQLMDEVDELLQYLLNTPPAQKISYHDVFKQYLDIDPHNASLTTLKGCAENHKLAYTPQLQSLDKDAWLQLLLSHCIEPHLGQQQPTMIYDYPKSQAALARIRPDHPPVAERFEVYVKGVELANGYFELTDQTEQLQRFKSDIEHRSKLGHPVIPMDQCLLDAMAHGLPDCAGVALGVDRLIMLATDTTSIDEVISFSSDRV